MSADCPLIILGGGGHASVLVEMLLTLKRTILGFVAPYSSQIKGYPQVPYLGADQIIDTYSANEIKLVNGLGAISVEKNSVRQQLFEKYKKRGFNFETIIHPSAILASTVKLEEGVQIMARVVLQSNVKIGSNTVINTGSCIDHDCEIGQNVHVAPSVALSGNVKVGNCAMIGIGACVIQGIRIAPETMVRAGALLVKDKLNPVE